MLYSGRVLVGFWLDKLQLELEQREEEDKKRIKYQLPCQRRRRLQHCFIRAVPDLSPNPACDYIQFGQYVQLHAPEVIDMSYKLEGDKGCPDAVIPWGPRQLGLILTATAAPDDVKFAKMGDGCAVACSPIRCPASRNVFKIVGENDEAEGDCLTFGREFYLQLPHANEILYLRSETPLIDGQFGPKYHNPVRLNVTKDCYAKWRVNYWNKQERFETEGSPIPPCIRIVIQHVMTGQCLAAEHLKWHRSVIGYECGASVHTYADVHRNETSECIWNFLVPKNYG